VFPMLRYMNLVYTFSSYFRFISILSFHLRVCLRSSIFTSGCRTKRACTSVLPIPTHDAPISSSCVLLSENYLMRITSHEAPRHATFSVSYYFFLPRPKYYFMKTLFSSILSLCSLLNLREKCPHHRIATVLCT
jgi:hypothetical protein